MNNIKSSIIDNLNFEITEKNIVTYSGNSITFSKVKSENVEIEGTFIVDSSLTGIYKIIFIDSLTIILTAKDNFKFKTNSDQELNSIVLTGVDIKSIIELFKHVRIKLY